MNKIVLVSIFLLFHNYSTAQYIPTSKACTVHGEIYDIVPLVNECDFNNIRTDIIVQPIDDPLSGKILVSTHERLEPHNPECFDWFPL